LAEVELHAADSCVRRAGIQTAADIEQDNLDPGTAVCDLALFSHHRNVELNDLAEKPLPAPRYNIPAAAAAWPASLPLMPASTRDLASDDSSNAITPSDICDSVSFTKSFNVVILTSFRGKSGLRENPKSLLNQLGSMTSPCPFTRTSAPFNRNGAEDGIRSVES